MNKILDILIWVCLLLLVIGAMAAIGFQIEAITFYYPLDYGEAPLLNQAVQLNAGNPLYQTDLDQPPFTIANYPPVYVGILAIFERLIGPAFWYGRLLSSLCAIGSAVLITLITFSRSRDWKTALIPGLLFINLPYVVGWSTLVRIDHLALFLALMGLYCLFRREPSSGIVNASLLWGSLFLILAIYTRQSYALAAPMAGFLYLIHKSWKRAVILAVVVGGMSLLFFLVFNFLTGGGFYFNIVSANINPFSLERLNDNFRNFYESAPAFFILGAAGLLLSIKRIDGWLMLIGFTIGGLLSALTIGKIGSNINYFLEFAAAISLLIGLGIVVLMRKSNKTIMGVILSIGLIILSWQTVKLIWMIQNETKGGLRDRQTAHSELETLEDLVIQNMDRPILADEYMGLMVLNGQNLYLQPFEITQLVNANLFEQDILINQIEDEAFSLILIQEASWWSNVAQERWTPAMLETIRSNYRVSAQLENTLVYKPKSRRPLTITTECPNGHWPFPTQAYLGYQYQEGILTFYGAGQEGDVPVTALADGEVYRPSTFPEGTLLIVHQDPLKPTQKVITLFSDMVSYRDQTELIIESFQKGAAGERVEQGGLVGYQSMWSGELYKPDWSHVKFGVAPFDIKFLEDYDLLLENLIDPSAYFGILVDKDTKNIRPITCQ